MTNTIRVMSYNIRRGWGPFRKRNVVESLCEAINDSPADIICLQEVWSEDPIEHGEIERCLRESWHQWNYYRLVAYDSGSHQGNAIISRYPLKGWIHKDLSVSSYEKRGMILAEIEYDSKLRRSCYVACVHFGLTEKERAYQAECLLEVVESHVGKSSALIIAGDFNDWRKRLDRYFQGKLELHEAFKTAVGCYAKTFPSFMPVMTLDRIYFRNCKLNEVEAPRGGQWRSLSDHLPIEAEFHFSD